MRTVTRPYADPAMQKIAEWTATMLDAAEPSAALIGCTPAAVVAQAALETGWGASAIGHNIFGVKAGNGWRGAQQLVTTREWDAQNGRYDTIEDWFRDYPTYAESFADHFKFLQTNSHYASVFDPNNTKSDAEYFQALQDDGYATDPNYAQSLMNMLKTIVGLEQRMTVNGGEAPVLPVPRLLLIGCTGADVLALQKRLGIRADSRFGPVTQAAVRKFQAEHHLTIDGIVGPATQAELGKAAS